ncbi:MAG: hypothetical protein IB618_01455 [Candidatus Pacearchaeota archaeon]|nr:MAG: hypothetical protein IB618_01455 [Candidatus Pacearchaeota archaeon]
MFKKKIKCRCGKKVDADFSYCPFCGRALREVKKFEEDHEKEIRTIEKSFEEAFKMPFFIKFPFKRLIRDIDKQFREMDRTIGERKNLEKMPVHTQGISIKVESSPDGQPVIKVRQFGPGQKIPLEIKKAKRDESEEEKIKLPARKLTKAQQAKLAKLPKEEPQTTVRRLTDKIIYEIILPGVKSEKDIIINKLQNSIEIKAFTKNKAYFKLIPVALPIKNYYLEKDKLVLELRP